MLRRKKKWCKTRFREDGVIKIAQKETPPLKLRINAPTIPHKLYFIYAIRSTSFPIQALLHPPGGLPIDLQTLCPKSGGGCISSKRARNSCKQTATASRRQFSFYLCELHLKSHCQVRNSRNYGPKKTPQPHGDFVVLVPPPPPQKAKPWASITPQPHPPYPSKPLTKPAPSLYIITLIPVPSFPPPTPESNPTGIARRIPSLIWPKTTDRMCRTTTMDFHPDRLKIKAFFVHFSFRRSSSAKPFSLPNSLTLVFRGAPLKIDGSYARPNSPVSFLTLHRIVSVAGLMKKTAATEGGAAYGSTERVTACDGVRFEVYLGDEKVLKGVLRKDEAEEWRMECRCGLERDATGGIEAVSAAEVMVAAEGQETMSESVGMAAPRRRRGKRTSRGFRELEEIPEEVEGFEGDGGGDVGSHDGESEDEWREGAEVVEFGEGGLIRWAAAVDVGIWVICLGVGFLVSKASSSKTLRRRSTRLLL